VGIRRVDLFVEAAEEVDGFEVFAAAEAVRNPLASFARVIEVKHRSDGVHAQTVDVILVEPEQGIADQEVADLPAAVVENERAPILVFAEARVGVFVEMGAVEEAQAVLVARKVRGYPIEDD